MIGDQCAQGVVGGRRRVDAAAGLVEHLPEFGAVPLGAREQVVEVDVDRLRRRQQPGQRGPPERRRLGAVGAGRVEMIHQARQGFSRLDVVRPEVVGQAFGEWDGGGGEIARDTVQRLDRRVHRVRPPLQVRAAGLGAVGLRRVPPLVGDQLEVVDVPQRVHAVQVEFAEPGAQGVLGGGGVRLVVRVGVGRAVRVQPRQITADRVRRQVLDHAVVLVPARDLARRGDGQVADRPESRVQVVGHAS
nr:hypothetical protein [Herbihabitans rhizosphaerae]